MNVDSRLRRRERTNVCWKYASLKILKYDANEKDCSGKNEVMHREKSGTSIKKVTNSVPGKISSSQIQFFPRLTDSSFLSASQMFGIMTIHCNILPK